MLVTIELHNCFTLNFELDSECLLMTSRDLILLETNVSKELNHQGTPSSLLETIEDALYLPYTELSIYFYYLLNSSPASSLVQKENLQLWSCVAVS